MYFKDLKKDVVFIYLADTFLIYFPFYFFFDVSVELYRYVKIVLICLSLTRGIKCVSFISVIYKGFCTRKLSTFTCIRNSKIILLKSDCF